MTYFKWALIVLTGILIILLILLFVQYESLRRGQAIGAHEFEWSQALEQRAPLSVSDADLVRAWMTFDYLNKIFALPENYLYEQLKIADTHYPHITISGYAKNANLDQTIFLNQVENAIRDYIPAGNTTSTAGGATKSK